MTELTGLLVLIGLQLIRDLFLGEKFTGQKFRVSGYNAHIAHFAITHCECFSPG